ncbi:hypothetical protein [Halostagnicola larsenii]|nr:hypothetical protein [Halostagnicola larsenii]
MPDNETLEKTVGTLIFFVVWGTIVVLPVLGIGDPPRYEIVISTTAIAFTILGKMWDYEVKRALDSLIATDGGQPRDTSENTDSNSDGENQ